MRNSNVFFDFLLNALRLIVDVFGNDCDRGCYEKECKIREDFTFFGLWKWDEKPNSELP